MYITPAINQFSLSSSAIAHGLKSIKGARRGGRGRYAIHVDLSNETCDRVLVVIYYHHLQD